MVVKRGECKIEKERKEKKNGNILIEMDISFNKIKKKLIQLSGKLCYK